MRTYDKPDIPAPKLLAEQQSNLLTPETDVTVIFRGGPPVHDMCDSRVYTIPPVPPGVTLEAWRAQYHAASYWTLPYAVAEHLRTRAIVPATRNPHDYRVAVSQLGIVGINRPDRCKPFTSEELKKFKYSEGLDRQQFQDSRSKVVEVDTSEALAQALAGGRDIDGEVAAAAETPGEAAVAPPAQHEGLAELQRIEREAQQAGVRDMSRTRKSRTRFEDEQ